MLAVLVASLDLVANLTVVSLAGAVTPSQGLEGLLLGVLFGAAQLFRGTRWVYRAGSSRCPYASHAWIAGREQPEGLTGS
mmetsp:Transcript_9961/g.26803  ORF Transcript_9961/g.26803 Transcript_9961/m.26803 type:complete len:80 (+) Transcript_9961:39-278(+)